MRKPILTPEALSRALALRDLTDPAQGPHALQLLLHAAVAALATRWRCAVLVERRSPLVSAADNYDRLRYPLDGAARDARHTRWVADGVLLRTQTSALVPPLLRRLSAAPPREVLLVCPGIVYRRDAIDRLHTGEPHQVDLWRVRRDGPALGEGDLDEMIATVCGAVAPGRPVRVSAARHPYTLRGRQLDVAGPGPATGRGRSPSDPAAPRGWLEVGECGLAHPAVLAEAGLPGAASGLAMGLGLDRLLMLAKGLDDIRLLRAADPRIAAQLLDLAPYRPVSHQPAIVRDLSVAVPAGLDAEGLGDRVREALGPRANDVEVLEVLAETPREALPEAARARLGIRPGQKNALVRLVLRAPDRTLTAEEANGLRDAVYAAVHEGTAHEWASRGPPVNRPAA